jgi:hypothetical protein
MQEHAKKSNWQQQKLRNQRVIMRKGKKKKEKQTLKERVE